MQATPPDVWQQFEEVCLRSGIGADVLLQERFAGEFNSEDVCTTVNTAMILPFGQRELAL